MNAIDPRVIALALAGALVVYAGAEAVKGVKKLGCLMHIHCPKVDPPAPTTPGPQPPASVAEYLE